jgi:nicotinate phosphoribosyltransferase
VYLALKYGVMPIGTIAHEWIMAIGALKGYKNSNGLAMDMWEEGVLSESVPKTVYPRGDHASPLTMLTDTFTAKAFFVDFVSQPDRAVRWTTLRQDSGDPETFVKQAVQAWDEIDQSNKGKASRRVIFSDGLDVDRALALERTCDSLGVKGLSSVLFDDSVFWYWNFP